MSKIDDVKITFIPDACTQDDIISNLTNLLKKKENSMKIYSKCHEYLSYKYLWYHMILSYTIIIIAFLSLILSLINSSAKENCSNSLSTSPNIAWTVTTAAIALLKGIHHVTDYVKLSKTHESSYKLYLGLYEDMELVLMKNSHTKLSLQNNLDTFEERIKNIRKDEAIIPINIKNKYVIEN